MASFEGFGAGVGMGTMEHVDGSRGAEAMYDATLVYLKQGGRYLDCAEMYASTAHVGRAIADSGVERASLHVTTKLAGLPVNRGDFHGPPDYDAVRERLMRHLAELGLDRADLLLIHWPGPPASRDAHPTDGFSRAHASELLESPETLAAACSWAFFDEHVDAAWDNLKRLRDEGLCARIGVSNMNEDHLMRLAARRDGAAAEPPFANQIFLDVTHQV